MTKLFFCTHVCCIDKQVGIQGKSLHVLKTFLSSTFYNIRSGGSLHATQHDNQLKADMPVTGYASRHVSKHYA